MDLDVVLLREVGDMVDGLAEQVHIVVIEWSGYPVKSFYCIEIQHIVVQNSVKFLPILQKRQKAMQK